MSRNLRKYAQSTTIQLILGSLIILFIVGFILIYIFYGKNAAVLGLICLSGTIIPVGIILLILFVTERFLDSEKKKQE